MVHLARVMGEALVSEFGPEEFLRRLADPVWFQSLGCVLGFDWHSSGLTTTTTGALKEALRDLRVGVYAAGGKGGTSRKTPEMIEKIAAQVGLDPDPLVHTSRLVAKVDSAALQDGYALYHHVIFFANRGSWAVIQQGMNPEVGLARRYHWLSEGLISFVEEPHAGIAAWRREKAVINLVARQARPARNAILALLQEKPPRISSRPSRRSPSGAWFCRTIILWMKPTSAPCISGKCCLKPTPIRPSRLMNFSSPRVWGRQASGPLPWWRT